MNYDCHVTTAVMNSCYKTENILIQFSASDTCMSTAQKLEIPYLNHYT